MRGKTSLSTTIGGTITKFYLKIKPPARIIAIGEFKALGIAGALHFMVLPLRLTFRFAATRIPDQPQPISPLSHWLVKEDAR